ncbi:MAG: phosphoenolpyruvate--protein phosphotransferase, partial [Acidobacteria bacterium]|nr:phosphoenolpyruvate--protein phosphotransferase [Acidobacteriota bacterium]
TAERTLGEDHAYIFDAHILMLEDRRLLEEIEECVKGERVNAEWAVKVVTDRLLAAYAQIKDEYLRARHTDIEDVTRRLLVALKDARREPSRDNQKSKGEQIHERSLIKQSGDFSRRLRMIPDAVIVAEELLPSAVAELDLARVRAFVTDIGGWTSHTAIIARGLSIPAVVGLRELHRRARTGDLIIVDATQGEVILHPAPATIEKYRAQAAHVSASRGATAEQERAPLFTLDEKEICLRANVELPAEYEGVKRFGARGIGLYRSEFLLSHRGVMPDEDEQCEAYKRIVELSRDDGATVRLFDLGGDKLAGGVGEAEHNPALGLRAIRFSLQHQDVLRTQARAIHRAAAHGRLNIVLPMVSDLRDVRRAREIINEERERLEEKGVSVGSVKIGAMIEVPSAVLLADKIAREVDFFSLGTNDLVQYLLAVDRGNDDVADWFRSLHPSVLESIHRTLAAAEVANIPAVVCGEMAGTPAYAVMLIGLGAKELSMTPYSIPRVRRVVSNIRQSDAQELALRSLECETADDVEELVRTEFSARWPQLFTPQTLPAYKHKK